MIRLVPDTLLLWRAAQKRRRGPFKLTCCVTWVCDQQCTHCQIWQRPKSDELSAGEWRQVFRAQSETLSWLDLTGGEVTTRRDFAEIAIAAIEECPNLALLHYPTNGRRPALIERTTRAVLSANPCRLILSVSLDGPPALHDQLRGDDGSFERSIESYRRVRALGVEAYFGMTLSAWNLDQVHDTFEAIRTRVPDFAWRDLHVNFVNESPHYFGNMGIEQPDPRDLSAAIADLMAKRGAPSHPTHLLENLYLKWVGVHLQTGRSPLPCTSLSGNAFIDPAGMVYPCHIWDEPVAGLRDHDYSLATVFALPRARSLRQAVVDEACPGCWTPCEAYPTVLANLSAAVQSSDTRSSEPASSASAAGS